MSLVIHMWTKENYVFCWTPTIFCMGLLPDTKNCGCACTGNAGNVFPAIAGKRSRHTSRHVRYVRAVLHAGIANWWFPLKSAAEENVPSFPGACTTCNFTYLIRGPWLLLPKLPIGAAKSSCVYFINHNTRNLVYFSEQYPELIHASKDLNDWSSGRSWSWFSGMQILKENRAK